MQGQWQPFLQRMSGSHKTQFLPVFPSSFLPSPSANIPSPGAQGVCELDLLGYTWVFSSLLSHQVGQNPC